MHPKKAKKTHDYIKEIDTLRLNDELNPKYLFSTTHKELLVQIATGRIKVKRLAKLELKKRGLNREGFWVGFEEGRDINNY